MSLDVYLTMPTKIEPTGSARIFIREAGTVRELTRAEWDAKFPGTEPVAVVDEEPRAENYWRNITHNLNCMAEVAGIYQHLWRPDEIGIAKASQLIEPLTAGLARLKAEPGYFIGFNPTNGWGDYDGLVSFVSEYLDACREYPDADVSVSR